MVFISPFNTNRCCIGEFNKKLIKQKTNKHPLPNKKREQKQNRQPTKTNFKWGPKYDHMRHNINHTYMYQYSLLTQKQRIAFDMKLSNIKESRKINHQ